MVSTWFMVHKYAPYVKTEPRPSEAQKTGLENKSGERGKPAHPAGVTPLPSRQRPGRGRRLSVKMMPGAVLERKLTAGGLWLLIVESEQVFEVVKLVGRTPSSANSLKVVSALAAVNLIGC